MKYFGIPRTGFPPQLLEGPSPTPKQGEVLIEILACGLNFADLLMAKGQYQDTPMPPFGLGMEVCGTIIGHGTGVNSPPIGTRVVAFVGAGGLAERVCAAMDNCRIVPKSMSDTVAAGFLVAYGTSHLALTRRAKLQPKETLVVSGAAGGVGITAVEIGAAMGARVIAVARGPEKLAIARAAGAAHTIDASADIKAQLKALGGVDVVYDPVGGAFFKAAMGAVNREGRMIIIGFASGDIPEIKANQLLVKNIDVLGFYWGGYLKFNSTALTNSLDQLMQWFTQGRLAPRISHVLPLANAADGLELLSSRKATGKVVISIKSAV